LLFFINLKAIHQHDTNTAQYRHYQQNLFTVKNKIMVPPHSTDHLPASEADRTGIRETDVSSLHTGQTNTAHSFGSSTDQWIDQWTNESIKRQINITITY